MTPIRLLSPLLLLSLAALPGCFALRGSSGGGQTAAPTGARVANPADVAVPAGYRIEVVATGLNFPTAVAFDGQNRPHVTEAGYSYGEVFATPRLVRIEPGGEITPVAQGTNGPWTGVSFHQNHFFVAEGGVREGGAIVRIAPDGKLTPLIRGLPTKGDHHTNGPAVGPDGALYFGVGTATNSGVVGLDNYEYGWLEREPKFHDLPAKDVKLAGQNFATRNPLSPGGGDDATTGAFVPFGTATQVGQVVKGAMPCNGAILRIPLAGGEPQLVAWGLRNPYGLAFAPDGRLFCTEHSYDVRGSRPVYGTGDLLWRIATDAPPLWHGWPDFHGGEPLTWADHFQPPGKAQPRFLLAEHPNPPPKPAAKLAVHGGYCGFDFSRGGGSGTPAAQAGFGFPGQAFVAAFGDMAPSVGKVLAPVGFRVDRVDVNTGVIEAFAVNRGKTNGPASKLGTGGLERPIAARFDNTQSALYVVDFGVLTMDGSKPRPQANSGVLWRITRTGVGQ